ncbi:phage tail-collar fiber domain-containing protein [Psychrobacter alimentarius]|uniref:phage tail-collar fiber domain-containing protein n=1 Tax=Psychrobacter alimentarius TaxID=261164 RepID=UPI003FCFCECB
MANYYVLLTDHGKSFIANAQANSQLALTHVVLGDANDQPYLPESRLNQTKLVHQTAKLPVASVKVINETTAEVSAVVPSNVGGFNVHEIGITDSSGKLVYVGNFHGGYRPTLTEGAGGDMELIVTIKAENLATVVIEMDGNVVSATRDWVNERFQFLLRTLIPFGYQYDTHTATNPKPMFDELLGIATYWRRITGKIMLATDPNDEAIKDHSVILGQLGMTELANAQRPHVYPLQTSHKFERYNPDEVIETVWNVIANKNSIDEGDTVRFTVTANNLPDGQILNWSVKEGALNSTNNDISNPEKIDSGTVILQNGQAVINFTTTPDDNTEESQKHVRLSVGAPANLSINVPINDSGHHETVMHISQSTTNGIDLAEYFKTQSGNYPSASETVRFIVDAGVDIIAPDTATAAIIEGINWPIGATPIIENHGRVLGRGGDGGRSAYVVGYLDDNDSSVTAGNIVASQKGGNGGTGIKSVNQAITVENHSLIAGGGGGGGGQGAWSQTTDFVTVGGGGGTGGGAPLGKRSPNEGTLQMYLTDPNAQTPRYMLPADDRVYYTILITTDHTTLQGVGITNEQHDYKVTAGKSRSIYVPFNQDQTQNLLDDFEGIYYARYDGATTSISHPLMMSSNATIDTPGMGGYGGGETQKSVFIRVGNNIDLSVNHGGSGGEIGSTGSAGVVSKIFGGTGSKSPADADILKDSSSGGLAGYIKEGNVTINNLSGGVTKGR